jgi:hypothetical protein
MSKSKKQDSSISTTVVTTVEKVNSEIELLQATTDAELKKWTIKFTLRFVVGVITFLLLLLSFFVFTNKNSGSAIGESFSAAAKVLGVIVEAALK